MLFEKHQQNEPQDMVFHFHDYHPYGNLDGNLKNAGLDKTLFILLSILYHEVVLECNKNLKRQRLCLVIILLNFL